MVRSKIYISMQSEMYHYKERKVVIKQSWETDSKKIIFVIDNFFLFLSISSRTEIILSDLD